MTGTFFKNRHTTEKLQRVAEHFKVILLLGARQVGKSTLLSHLFPTTKHITFDPLDDIGGARQDPELFLTNNPFPLILDEVQYSPQLLPAIKRLVDTRPESGQYFLTGSQNFSVLKSVSESLAGRAAIVNMGCMTYFEATDQENQHWLKSYLDSPDTILTTLSSPVIRPSIFEVLWRGGLPGLLKLDNTTLVGDYLSSYIQTYIERDVRLMENIADFSLFHRLISLAAAHTAQEVNDSHFAREISLSRVMVDRWLRVLQSGYQWFEIHPFFGNAIKQITKKKKGYFADTGVACHLLRISSPDALAGHPLLGFLFETHCISMIRSIANTLSMAPTFSHWRSKNKAEVDLILERDGIIYPIEIKCKSHITPYDARGIRAFRETYPHLKIAKGLILYPGYEIYAVNPDVIALPWNALQ